MYTNENPSFRLYEDEHSRLSKEEKRLSIKKLRMGLWIAPTALVISIISIIIAIFR
ncbi:MAG: hypothetical protein FWC94_07820 [Bacteroidales bacterium]|nr:hypothetical protein [Bacteroidales bacterium]